MEPWLAIALFAIFAVGIGFGFLMGRSKDDSAAKVKQLEQALVEAEQDSKEYKEQVTAHFGKTAELFNQLTEDYKAVYEHLATSSHTLCGDQVAQLKAGVPQKGLLEAGEAVAEAAPEPAPEATAVEQEAVAKPETESVDTVAEEQVAEDVKKTEAVATEDTKSEAEAKDEDVAVAVSEGNKSEDAARTIH